MSDERAGPLKRLSADANGYLVEEEGREARSLERGREGEHGQFLTVTDCVLANVCVYVSVGHVQHSVRATWEKGRSSTCFL